MKKVSVAMITYNHEKYIKKALDSILSQNVNFEYEIVIGNDCSPDKTENIIKEYIEKYPNIIKNLERLKNLGALENLLDVLQNCTGEYIAFLEGDDYWVSSNKLKESVDFLENNLEYTVVYHDVDIIDSKGENIGHIKTKDISDLKNYLSNYEDIPTLSMVFRKSILDKLGIDELKKLFYKNKYVGDIQIKSLLLHNGKGKKIGGIKGVYRQDNENLSAFTFQKIENKANDIKTALYNIKKIFRNEVNYPINNRIFDQNLSVIISYLKANKIKEIILYFIEIPFFEKVYIFLRLPVKILSKLNKVKNEK